jgi:hypothetical protein
MLPDRMSRDFRDLKKSSKVDCIKLKSGLWYIPPKKEGSNGPGSQTDDY